MKPTPRARSENAEQILKEIRELHEQYANEISSKRKPWPKSIRERVDELWRIGLSSHEIAAATDLPAQTMYSWKSKRNRSPDFLPIEIVKEKLKSLPLQLSRLDTRPTEHASISSIIPITVTVVLPNGVRLEGLDADKALSFARNF
jgi:hypothetical protein